MVIDKLTSKSWWKEAGSRAIKTFFQSFASMLVGGAVLSDIDWIYVLSSGALSAIFSIATSIATIPDPESTNNED